jgi:putative aminopeptidase FrvX
MELLKQMCAIHAPSGNEGAMTEFIINYIEKNKAFWKVQPQVFHGKGFQNGVVLVFGKPRTAVYAHIDSIGFTVRYNNELVKIGGSRLENGFELVGEDSNGAVNGVLVVDEEGHSISLKSDREVERGTDLTFKPNFRDTDNFIQSNYLDNRLGVYNALKLAETLEDGAIAFTCWEEHGKGSASVIGKFLYEKFDVDQALISDISWVTEGVPHGKGTVVSMRDSGLPRRVYVNRIIAIAKESGIPFQLEVEGSGGSDGNELQQTVYPIDWCFVGAPEDFVHTPNEKVHKDDIKSMLALYRVLMEKL